MLRLLSDDNSEINMVNVARRYGQVHLFVVHGVDEAEIVDGVDEVELVHGVDELEVVHGVDETKVAHGVDKVEVLYICDAPHVGVVGTDAESGCQEEMGGLVDEVEDQCHEVEGTYGEVGV